MEKTGWGQGLFVGDEANSKLIEDKEQKVFVLQKVLDLVQMCIQEEVDVRPIKIVAGQECENTNIFLQKMFQAATMGVDTTEAVEQILVAYSQAEGGAKPQAEEPAAEEKPKKKKKDDKGDDKAKAKKEREEAEARAAQEAEEEERQKRREKKKRMQEQQQQQQEQQEETNERQQREEPGDRGQPSQVVGVTKAQKKKKEEGKKVSNANK